MKITDESLEEFKEIYRAEFKKEISDVDALEMATRLINLFQIIYRPLPGEPGYSAMPPSADQHYPRSASPGSE